MADLPIADTCRTVKQCFLCGEDFSRNIRGKRDARRFCSRECGLVFTGAQARARANGGRVTFRVRMKRAKKRTCRDCPTPIGKNAWRCEPCKKQAARAAKARGREYVRLNGDKAARRKARKLKVRSVAVEMVNPITVLDRDKWTCQLCGVRTPKRLRGTYDDRAPEVDHIMPIALGGEHSYRNVQCACRQCNLAKSGSMKGQLRLFG